MAELLRFATAGSVDDGKSTLIGRLLYDSKSIFDDQLSAVERTSRARGDEYTNLALLTDGLRAEREQGITIDVAYRYFATKRRRFIIADTPGHTQYTRNMVTGASTADLALILIDARKGVLEQSRRHAFLSTLLGIRHLVLCVNKLAVIPVSALHGDNIVHRSDRMPWYTGNALLSHLEEVHIASDRNLVDTRFPVQHVIRPQSAAFPDYRGYAGTITSGALHPGDDVMVLPSGFTTKVKTVGTMDGALDEAFAPMAVTVTLEDHLDVSRGDMICRVGNRPTTGQDIDAMICWMSDRTSMTEGQSLLLKHTTAVTRAIVRSIDYELDTETLHRLPDIDQLSLNSIGRVTLRTQLPLFFDAYRINRTTGAFILIDPATNNTVGAGTILNGA
jgi:bifunctional enzyme CysN/CysC